MITIKKLFVGSLPWAVDNQKLHDLFSEFGEITQASVVMDKMTGRSRGFGFVEFADDAAADAAIAKMNDADVEGRKLVVNEARPREDRPQNGGGNRY